MPMRRKSIPGMCPVAAIALAVGAVCLLSTAASGQIPYKHIQRTCNRCAVPNRGYGYDTPRTRATAIAVADAARDVVLPSEQRWPPSDAAHRADAPRLANWQETLPPPAAQAAKAAEQKPQRKPFHVRALALTAGPAKLEQLALSITDTGHVDSSGRLTHDGGPDGSLLGSKVTIRLRAFAAVAPDAERLPPDAPLVWQSQQTLWVARNQPATISLAPTLHAHAPELRRHFNEITHFEVELAAQQDR